MNSVIGDGLRSSSIADANDQARFGKFELQSELTKRAWAKGVNLLSGGNTHSVNRAWMLTPWFLFFSATILVPWLFPIRWAGPCWACRGNPDS